MSRVWTWTIFAFWALAMGVLFREKVMPGMLQAYFPEYQSLQAHPPKAGQWQMGIFIAGQKRESRIGWSRTLVEELIPESKSDPAYTVRTETTIDATALSPQLGEFFMRTNVLIDANLRVKTYDVYISCALGKMFLNGVVRNDTTLDLMISTPFQDTIKKELTFDSGMMLSNGLSPLLSAPELRIGRSWTIYQLDPLTAVIGGEVRMKSMEATVERQEQIRIEDDDVDAFVVRLKGERYEATVWVSEDGDILQERVPFAPGAPLVMRRETWTGPK